MLRRIMLACAALLAWHGRALAAEGWRSAETDHFVIYSQDPEAQLRDFANSLERFDKGLRLLLKLEDTTASHVNKLVVYSVSDTKVVQLYGGNNQMIGGFYKPRASGSVAVTQRYVPKSTKYDLDAQLVLYHEYAHHLLMGSSSSYIPQWLNEGFAEFTATAVVMPDGSLRIGGPAVYRAASLVLGEPLPLRTLFDADHRRLSTNGIDQLYARGWLLTNLLIFDPARAGQLGRYIEQVGRGVPSLVAAQAAFRDFYKLATDMERKRRARDWRVITIAASQLPVGPVSIRELSPGEAALMPLRMRSDVGVNEATAARLVASARTIAAAHPSDATVQGWLAEIEFDAKNYAECAAAADRALAIDPKSLQALVYRGRAAQAIAKAAKATDAATWKTVRAWFLKANHIAPEAADPLVRFYLGFDAQGIAPTANASLALYHAVELVPQDPHLHWLAAKQHLVDKKLPEARADLAVLAYDPHRDANNPVAALVAMIDAGKDADTVLTAARAAETGKGKDGSANGAGGSGD